MFALAAVGFGAALLEPGGIEPTLPEPICLAFVPISLGLAIWAAASARAHRDA